MQIFSFLGWEKVGFLGQTVCPYMALYRKYAPNKQKTVFHHFDRVYHGVKLYFLKDLALTIFGGHFLKISDLGHGKNMMSSSKVLWDF